MDWQAKWCCRRRPSSSHSTTDGAHNTRTRCRCSRRISKRRPSMWYRRIWATCHIRRHWQILSRSCPERTADVLMHFLSVTVFLTMVLVACAGQAPARPAAVDTPGAALTAVPTDYPAPAGRLPRPNQTPGPPPAGSQSRTDLAKLSDIKRDIVYCTANGVALNMDLYTPLGKG